MMKHMFVQSSNTQHDRHVLGLLKHYEDFETELWSAWQVYRRELSELPHRDYVEEREGLGRYHGHLIDACLEEFQAMPGVDQPSLIQLMSHWSGTVLTHGQPSEETPWDQTTFRQGDTHWHSKLFGTFHFTRAAPVAASASPYCIHNTDIPELYRLSIWTGEQAYPRDPFLETICEQYRP